MNKLLRILQTFFIAGILLSPIPVLACAWDSDTLAEEKKKKPEIAEIIFGTTKAKVDAPRLQKRIAELKSNPREDDAAWWNDLAGAYLRLGQPQEAANLLESVLKKFDSDYGIHANLGTAYHLLGRYQEAEKEIARDLEINPDAHFGLEKYHLALLQYLAKDEAYKSKHVYVDEFSHVFLDSEWGEASLMSYYSAERDKVIDPATATNDFPDYRLKWNLAGDTNFSAGVAYMATLNSREPASFVMLGVASLANGGNRDLNLASAAFQKAIDLKSPQTDILKKRIEVITAHVNHADGIGFAMIVGAIIIIAALVIGRLILKFLIGRLSKALMQKLS
jgi:tetratricopeptide (TPR) repeat protein